MQADARARADAPKRAACGHTVHRSPAREQRATTGLTHNDAAANTARRAEHAQMWKHRTCQTPRPPHTRRFRMIQCHACSRSSAHSRGVAVPRGALAADLATALARGCISRIGFLASALASARASALSHRLSHRPSKHSRVALNQAGRRRGRRGEAGL